MIKTNIKMRVTPEQSKKVQEICFRNGVYWYNIHNKDKVIVYSDYLYIDEYITHDSLNNLIHFKESINQEIDADYFIRTNGTCEEDLIDKINNQWNRIKELEQQLNKIGSESEKQLKEKDTIISYLESKLK